MLKTPWKHINWSNYLFPNFIGVLGFCIVGFVVPFRISEVYPSLVAAFQLFFSPCIPFIYLSFFNVFLLVGG